MKRLFKRSGKPRKPIDPPLITTNAVGSSSNPAIPTSTIIESTTQADPMPSILASAATASLQVIQAPGVTTAHEVSPPVSSFAIAPMARLESANPPPFPDSTMQANVRSTESEQNFSTQPGLFTNAQNVLVTGVRRMPYKHCLVVLGLGSGFAIYRADVDLPPCLALWRVGGHDLIRSID